MTSKPRPLSRPNPRPRASTRLSVVPLSPVPLYTQIKDILRERILDGSVQPHQQMPSESEMIASFGVSRITVRQALNDLQNEGLIFKIHGKGTFVSKPKAFQDLAKLQGFGEAMRSMGYETFSRVVGIKAVAAPPPVAEKLSLGKKERVTELKRVRFLNREPISFDISFLPLAIGERLAKEDLAARDVFLILENDYGLSLGHADLQIGSTLADEAVGRQLRVEEGAPVLFIERLTHTADGKPVDYEHLYYRGDAFQYKVRVDRVPLHSQGV